MSFWGELKRRNVVKVGIAYIIVTWLTVQVADIVLPTFSAPDWVTRTITLLLILGFPIVLIVAWAFEVTPSGIKKTDTVRRNALRRITGEKLNHAITALLGAVVVFLVVDDYLDDLELEQTLRLTRDFMETAPPPLAQPENAGVLPNSIAVLPCENLSPDPNNAHFAAGLHDEVLNQLTKLKSLNVIARTSMLQYQGAARPITEIAKELKVQSIMECSVSYADERIAVRAQLIDASTGFHLWADRFNRDLADVIEIQAEIAMNIANALQAEFSVAEQQRIEKRPTENLAAYGLYLRALAAEGDESIGLLDEALALDPQFAVAHALKAQRYAYSGRFIDNPDPEDLADWIDTAQKEAETAVKIDSTLGAAHVALGILNESRLDFGAARQSFDRAYELTPNDPVVLEWNTRFYRNQGEFERATEIATQMAELNPNDWWLQHLLGVTHRYAGDFEAAAEGSRNAIRLAPVTPNPHVGVALAEAVLGNLGEALDELEIAESLGAQSSPFRLAQMALAYSRAARVDDVQRLFEEFREIDQQNAQPASLWAMFNVALGDYEQALTHIERAIASRAPSEINLLVEFKWNGWGDPHMLTDPTFVSTREGIFSD
jgi:TolB-like protein/Flp pilus assembly protein TadD